MNKLEERFLKKGVIEYHRIRRDVSPVGPLAPLLKFRLPNTGKVIIPRDYKTLIPN